MQNVGKEKKLERIFAHESGKIVIVPLDDSLLAGPINGLENLKNKTEKIILAKPNAIIGFQGMFKNFSNIIKDTPSILNITASTTRSIHTRKVLVGSLELAIMLGVEAVAVHVNISSKYESEMLKSFADISLECHRLGMPILGIMYPRKEFADGSDNNYYDLKQSDRNKYAELVAHSARVGVELGADFIKTQYTGDSETFNYVVESCKPIPIVVAGGSKVEMLDMLKIAEGANLGGGSGISFGRNIFSRDNPAQYINAVKKVVFENQKAEDVYVMNKSIDSVI
jgi:DhnA family fructose-bisphosphate aldolase class Ia